MPLIIRFTIHLITAFQRGGHNPHQIKIHVTVGYLLTTETLKCEEKKYILETEKLHLKTEISTLFFLKTVIKKKMIDR